MFFVGEEDTRQRDIVESRIVPPCATSVGRRVECTRTGAALRSPATDAPYAPPVERKEPCGDFH